MNPQEVISAKFIIISLVLQETVPERIDEIVTEDPEDFVFYSPFKDDLDNLEHITDEEKYVFK